MSTRSNTQTSLWFPLQSAAHRDKSRVCGRLKAKVEPLSTLGESGIPCSAQTRCRQGRRGRWGRARRGCCCRTCRASTPYTLHSTPHTLHPTPYTLLPTLYTLHPTPFTLPPTPYTLHPTPYTLHPTPYTLHPTPYTLHPAP